MSLPSVQQLVASVDATEFTDLDRVRAAVVMADDLGALGDQVVSHFVQAARHSACSWSQIGEQLGVSKQAAQQAFVAPPRRGRFGRRPSGRRPGRWSDDAKAVVIGAREEAGALGHDHVGTEHLLLALCAGTGPAASALRGLGIEHAAVRDHVEELIGRCSAGSSGRRPFTPRTKKILELSAQESARLQHTELRAEHLLLALVGEGEGLAAQIVVQKLGVHLDLVRQTVLRLFADGGPPAAGGRPTG